MMINTHKNLYYIFIHIAFFIMNNTSAIASPENLYNYQGKYYVAFLHSDTQPIPLHRIHSWQLAITTLQGTAVEKADIEIFGGMPAHRHGLPTQPVIEETGAGNYRIQGMKFSMTGEWELWFEIKTIIGMETAKFTITL